MLSFQTEEAGPLRGLEGVPGLPGAPQDEAGLTRKFETSHRIYGNADEDSQALRLLAVEEFLENVKAECLTTVLGFILYSALVCLSAS